MSARLIQVIETHLQIRGRGEEGDPVRRIRQYWSVEGELLAEVDEWTGPQYSAVTERAEKAEDEVKRLGREVKTLDGTCKNLAAVVQNTENAAITMMADIGPALPNLRRVAKRSPTVRTAVAAIEKAVTDGREAIRKGRFVSLFT